MTEQQPQFTTPPPGWQPVPQNPEKNGFGITAIITAIIGLLFCLMPITGFIGFILGVIALIFGLAGWGRVRKNKATNVKTAITGAVLGGLAIAGGIAGIVMFFTAVEDFGNDMDKIGDDWSSYSDCMADADTSAEMAACK
ncbi:DUF4190 domain-containing protein [Rhodococcus sp. PvR099]|uniref:DUF4190 domain-containing protein n=1 Tax=Rhodococcus sp. PvR099 TaxID=2806602 RepID=UPI001AE615B0|nr:DUF4190 domain-containing protein [Rhodococcus sp. PvR099]MBP1160242.1 hypothetical protein [Rhodococcus sp. PvR099]